MASFQARSDAPTMALHQPGDPWPAPSTQGLAEMPWAGCEQPSYGFACFSTFIHQAAIPGTSVLGVLPEDTTSALPLGWVPLPMTGTLLRPQYLGGR